MNLSVHPLTPNNWSDFEVLFGEKGACGGCWCMWYRLKRSKYESTKGSKNRSMMKKIVDSGIIPGILAFDGSKPVGWCSLGPREEYTVLSRSRILKPVDNKKVWSIVCIFINKEYRKKGLTEFIIKSALDFTKLNNVKILEAYPIDTENKNYPVVFAHTGFISTYYSIGFKECARRSSTRPILRYLINED